MISKIAKICNGSEYLFHQLDRETNNFNEQKHCWLYEEIGSGCKKRLNPSFIC
jgi:hypothetical protein